MSKAAFLIRHFLQIPFVDCDNNNVKTRRFRQLFLLVSLIILKKQKKQTFQAQRITVKPY